MRRGLGLALLFLGAALCAASLRADGMMEANSLYKIGLWPEASVAYESLAKDPSQAARVRARAWQGAGNCALMLKDRDRAWADYGRALSLDPSNAALRAYVARQWPGPARESAPAPVSAVTPGAFADVDSGLSEPAPPSDSWEMAGLKSLALPGWEQYDRGETAKGTAFGVLAFGAWLAYAWSWNDTSAKVGKYHDYVSQARADLASGQPYDGTVVDGAYEQANSAEIGNEVILGALITVYGIAAWDAIRGTPSVKKRLFNVSLMDGGARVDYAWRF